MSQLLVPLAVDATRFAAEVETVALVLQDDRYVLTEVDRPSAVVSGVVGFNVSTKDPCVVDCSPAMTVEVVRLILTKMASNILL
jgi:hypothetical protein